jgi:hypothetical protein
MRQLHLNVAENIFDELKDVPDDKWEEEISKYEKIYGWQSKMSNEEGYEIVKAKK